MAGIPRQARGIVGADGLADIAGRDMTGFVGVADALAVPGVDGAGRITDCYPVGADHRRLRKTHGQLSAHGLGELGLCRKTPVAGGGSGVVLHHSSGIDVFPPLQGRQQTHSHIYGSVAEWEHPPVSGHGRPGLVSHVELALEERVGRARRRVVAPSRQTHRVVLATH